MALECVAVPRSAAGIVLGIVAGGATGKKAGRVRNYVIGVVLAHTSINSSAVYSRLTGTFFEVKHKCGARDKCPAAASERAGDIPWTVYRRVEML